VGAYMAFNAGCCDMEKY